VQKNHRHRTTTVISSASAGDEGRSLQYGCTFTRASGKVLDQALWR
jgi:hypothetical protein